jgi:hypothetical protein
MTGKCEVYLNSKTGRIARTSSGYEHGCPCDAGRNDESMVLVGKKAAGRTLDGRTCDEYPLMSSY